MKKQHFNIIAKPVEGAEYLLTDMIATRLNRAQFEKPQALNPGILGGYKFIPYNETDFSWWMRICKYLTPRKITSAAFDVDYFGNVTKLY